MCSCHSPNQSTLGRLMKDKPSTEATLCLQAARKRKHTLTQKYTPSLTLPHTHIHTHTALIKFTDVKALITKANPFPPSCHSSVHLSLHRSLFPTPSRATRTALSGTTDKAVSFKLIFLTLTHIQQALSPTYAVMRTCSDRDRESVSRQLLICYVAERTVMNFLQNKRTSLAHQCLLTDVFLFFYSLQ